MYTLVWSVINFSDVRLVKGKSWFACLRLNSSNEGYTMHCILYVCSFTSLSEDAPILRADLNC